MEDHMTQVSQAQRQDARVVAQAGRDLRAGRITADEYRATMRDIRDRHDDQSMNTIQLAVAQAEAGR